MNGVEWELKAGLAHADWAAVRRRVARQAGPGQRRRLLTRYFDTPDGALEAQGIALRWRTGGRGQALLSVKAGRRALGGFQRSDEREFPWPQRTIRVADLPDSEWRRRLVGLVGEAPLVERFATRVERWTFRLARPEAEVELAFDRGRIEAGARIQPISEVEFELLAGAPEALFKLAAELLGGLPAELDLPNKADRGAALARGTPWVPAPRASRPPTPARKVPAGDAFARTLALLTEALAANLSVTHATDDPEGPHQLRVALRRLRTTLWLYRPILEPDCAKALIDKARHLGRVVAEVRDADVQAEDWLLPRADPSLAEAIDAWRNRARARVRSALAHEQATAFAIRLMELSVTGGWQRSGARTALAAPVGELVEPRIGQLWRRIRKRGARLGVMSAAERHEFRKRLKKLRYALELAPADPTGRRFIQGLRALQDDLGTLNDLAVLEGLAIDLGEPERNAALAELVARLRAERRAEADRLLGRACRHWTRLAGLSPLPSRAPDARPMPAAPSP
ncbi:MAG: CHAD domain-containing protein [Sphingomonadaceae bacterium]|uniref:CYTH and CHAD domain-containing protein n=1 Tax=Thermaurantiacus sp. TaxID=2820283 RepID=UPI00298EDD98|nr:CHAD domain-containing protein [Thermaurantiacus sp.]MCS6985907.1 CHAD domain-containing protein [Sphingomonadaceae bacterium]MDW8414877.1 CHAD domain-containing protein [Thermaurantiacus sp.]